MFNRKNLKQTARQIVKAAQPGAGVVTLIYMVITYALCIPVTILAVKWMDVQQIVLMNYDVSALMGRVLVLNLITLAISAVLVVLQYGYVAFSMKLFRGEQTAIGNLFGAVMLAPKVVGCSIMVAIFTVLWSMLFMVPAVILITVLLIATGGMFSGMVLAAIVVIYLALLVAIIFVALRYSLTPYFLLDHPEAGVFAAIRSSKLAMKGNSGKCFMLLLSFLGWSLLIAAIIWTVTAVGTFVVILLSGGVNFSMTIFPIMGFMLLGLLASLPITLWLTAYQSVTFAGFYDTVSGERDNQSALEE